MVLWFDPNRTMFLFVQIGGAIHVWNHPVLYELSIVCKSSYIFLKLYKLEYSCVTLQLYTVSNVFTVRTIKILTSLCQSVKYHTT